MTTYGIRLARSVTRDAYQVIVGGRPGPTFVSLVEALDYCDDEHRAARGEPT